MLTNVYACGGSLSVICQVDIKILTNVPDRLK